jgi:hypothetical protein
LDGNLSNRGNPAIMDNRKKIRKIMDKKRNVSYEDRCNMRTDPGTAQAVQELG